MKMNTKFVIFVAIRVLLISVIYGSSRSVVAVADRICSNESTYCVSIGDNNRYVGLWFSHQISVSLTQEH